MLWAKSTRKQESTATIGVNDTASTYRITIGGQNESVPGNAGGSAATATDLANQCAASVQSQFTLRTFTVSTDTLSIQADDAGILYTFSASVISGTGTITTTNNQFLLPVSIPDSPTTTAEVNGHLAIPCARYGVLILDVDNGDVVACAVVEDPPTGSPASDGAAIVNGTTYLCGQSPFPAAFGEDPDSDWQVFRFDAPPNNRTLLLDDVVLSTSAFTILNQQITGVSIEISSLAVVEAEDEFEILETEYTY